MKVISHGKWALYTPAPALFERLKLAPTHGIIFSRRVDTGEDWYDYQKKFPDTSVAVTINEQPDGPIVGAASRDASRVFPGNGWVIEITGYTGKDPQAEFGNKVFDMKSKFTDRPVPPPLPDTSKLQDEVNELKAQVAALLKKK